MDNSIIVALITGGAAVAGQYLIAKKNRADDSYERGQRDKHLDDQIKNLTDRVEEHNKYAKMFSDLTTTISLMAQDIKYIKEGKFKHDDSKQI